MLWHKLSELPVVSIAKLRGRARGAGSELALACDMRFAARENAILGQIEVGTGAAPGAGGVQHLARLLGRGRAMEAILGAADFNADEAERYGWINRALPDAELDAFVAHLARRIASFPAEAVLSTKQVLNELTLPGADAIRADARRFQAAGLLGGEVREGYAEVGDQRLHYVEAGEGPLIVLLHGFPEFWYGWRLQIQPLAAAGFRASRA
jgi:enoyl-CoA hydratase/carnithine racemase